MTANRWAAMDRLAHMDPHAFLAAVADAPEDYVQDAFEQAAVVLHRVWIHRERMLGPKRVSNGLEVRANTLSPGQCQALASEVATALHNIAEATRYLAELVSPIPEEVERDVRSAAVALGALWGVLTVGAPITLDEFEAAIRLLEE